MAKSPLEAADGAVRLTILSDGQALPDSVQILCVTVHHAVNCIPTAEIIVADGDMASGTFAVSEGEIFIPGAEVQINAGHGDQDDFVFGGIVVKHSLRIDYDGHSQLIITCRDKAIRMTLGRHHANYAQQKDSDIMTALIARNSLDADVQSTDCVHESLVQHYFSDWDFLLTRADANSLLVIAKHGTVSVKPPEVSGEPTLKVAYGDSLVSFHAELDAHTQWATAQSFAWDHKSQTVMESKPAYAPSLNQQGNIDSRTLADVLGSDSYHLKSGAPLSKMELDAWAKSAEQTLCFARVRGQMKFQGSAEAAVGGLIELSGVGARFNGNVFVSAVEHKIVDGNWFTEVDFGLPPTLNSDRADVVEPMASGLVAGMGVGGLQIGVVSQLENDPQGEGRVFVTVPMLGANANGLSNGIWARLCAPYATKAAGVFFVPEIGDEVVLGYFDQNPSYPVIIGSLHSSARPTPYANADDNHIKAIVTRSGARIEFNDADKVITVTTPDKNKIVLSDKDRGIQLMDQNDNKVTLTPSGISLSSAKDIQITANGNVTIDAVGNIDIAAKLDLKTSGLNIHNQAQIAFAAKGGASAELSAAGQTVVKGAIVMIN
jgi:Rhs element Vgr protein